MNSESLRVIQLLNEVKSNLQPGRSSYFAGIDDELEVIQKIDRFIYRIQNKDNDVYYEIGLCFLATGVFKELSISNGWSDEYLRLSSEWNSIRSKLNLENSDLITQKVNATLGISVMLLYSIGAFTLSGTVGYIGVKRIFQCNNSSELDEFFLMCDRWEITIYILISLTLFIFGSYLFRNYLRR
jgi:hypothetical protein